MWIRIFPDKPVTRKPPEVKMGGGKGDVDHYVAVVRAGRIIFELDGLDREEVYQNKPGLEAIMKEYKGKVRVVWMNNPLGFHKNAMPAAEAAYTIYKLKGDEAFWKAHKKFFENQRKLGDDFYKEVAKELGVDMAKFEESLSKHTYQGIIKSQQMQGVRIGARGTPAFFINGKFLSGAQPYDNFKRIIDQEIKNAEAMLKKGTPKSKIYETLMKNAEKSVK
jgi:predicted DsbA family dithiol-disulfide isomerase